MQLNIVLILFFWEKCNVRKCDEQVRPLKNVEIGSPSHCEILNHVTQLHPYGLVF